MFKEWDRVIVNYPEFKVVNEKGTVVEKVSSYEYAVRLDRADSDTNHCCNGKCHEDHGLWIPPDNLTLITNKPA